MEQRTVKRQKLKLGDILVQQNVVTAEKLQEALKKQRGSGKKLGEMMVEMNLTTEEAIGQALSRQLGYKFINLNGLQIPDKVIKLIKSDIVKKYTAIPLGVDEKNNNVLFVAMADPMDMNCIDDFAIITNMQIMPVVSTPRQIRLQIDKYYASADVKNAADEYAKEREKLLGGGEEGMDDVSDDINNSPIVVLVKQMIEQAVRQRTSDIHIEPMENQVRIRYRIDGALYERMTYNPSLLPAITARIKIIGGMDISEKRKPQDGRITQVVDGQEFDIRVSVLPTVYGEKTVMRLTSKTGLTRQKNQLGFRPDEEKKFDHILANPHGIILVTGPTGSGKSTTLYTALSELNKEDVNIITVEDPVEANIDGINQVHVNVKAELTFASALRSILRQDPDIIMIGEIRDGETAGIAVQASITGHLVVSTLHTNSTSGTIGRLIDMGVEPYLLADAIVGIIAQRLVRRLCPKCKKKMLATEEQKELLGIAGSKENIEIYEPVGCDECDKTGFKGRIGVYEIMEITPKLKPYISRKASAEELKEVALSEGMNTLRMSATKLVFEGITSVAEMVRVSFDS
ncbi:MAG: Flp pilus assembly complex ATPase component TadA [Lachnospiraceae bacterium]|nr:Flp pilus assembly complex ATPase component TadA [Lachnospiraceae bacterium]